MAGNVDVAPLVGMSVLLLVQVLLATPAFVLIAFVGQIQWAIYLLMFVMSLVITVSNCSSKGGARFPKALTGFVEISLACVNIYLAYHFLAQLVDDIGKDCRKVRQYVPLCKRFLRATVIHSGTETMALNDHMRDPYCCDTG